MNYSVKDIKVLKRRQTELKRRHEENDGSAGALQFIRAELSALTRAITILETHIPVKNNVNDFDDFEDRN